MIVPMKKVSLIVLNSEKRQALKQLRRLGLLHIDISQASSTRLTELREQISLLENAIYVIGGKAGKAADAVDADLENAILTAKKINELIEKKAALRADINSLSSELERLRDFGDIDISEIAALAKKGIEIKIYDMPTSVYKSLDEQIRTVVLSKNKNTVKFLTADISADIPQGYLVRMPQSSTADMREEIQALERRIGAADQELGSLSAYIPSMRSAIAQLHKEIELETYAVGMNKEALSDSSERSVSIAYLSGYIPAEELDRLLSVARENRWGIVADDPTPDDDVPTKLKNNKLVSLIYPLTDFLGTVPGYFEYDISAWFLGFILIFFGIIFGDGGYGLLICGVAAALMIKARIARKKIQPMVILIALLGGATVLWGMLTCTWFGLSPEQLPTWLKSLSLPIISNVNSDKIWYPFWTGGEAGLTTAQMVQIVCFSLALIQLTVAHIKGMVRNRRSLKLISDLGSIFQLVGMFYVVLTLVVNGAVFGLGRVIAGIPVGIASIALIGVGFVMSFVFANYDGSIKKSILESLKNIVSVLLGVVNVFSDIVSYIRLWAVGLAGAAISATVNELAGPLFGNLAFIILAVMLLVFGHGLNMILNVLSVIVHGVRLNTLEFSTHLDMSWSGHKFKPFEE